jgi:WXG100 family type VII secretion target
MASINGVKVNTQEIENYRKRLNDDNEDIKRQLSNVKKSMDYLKGTEIWKSEGATAIQSKFDTLSPVFDKFYKAVTDYIEFLDRTVEKYSTTERAITQDARNVSDWD